MKKITYKITIEEGSKIYKEQVNGYHAFDRYGFSFGVHKSPDGWTVSELSTGLSLGKYADTRKQAIAYCDDMPGEETTRKAVQGALRRFAELGV